MNGQTTYFITRAELSKVGFSNKAIRQFEEMQYTQAETSEKVSAQVEATDKLIDASFLVLSKNTDLANERVLTLGPGLSFSLSDGEATIDTTGLVQAAGGHRITFVGAGETEVLVPLNGTLATRENAETLENKTLDNPRAINLVNAADDTAAAAAGVEVNEMYRNGSAVMVRVA